MYGTTREFLDYFNLKSLSQLPTLQELRDIDSINAELDLEDGMPEDTDGELVEERDDTSDSSHPVEEVILDQAAEEIVPNPDDTIH